MFDNLGNPSKIIIYSTATIASIAIITKLYQNYSSDNSLKHVYKQIPKKTSDIWYYLYNRQSDVSKAVNIPIENTPNNQSPDELNIMMESMTSMDSITV